MEKNALKFKANTKTWKEWKLVHFICSNPIYIKNILPVIQIGNTGCNIKGSCFIKLDMFFNSKVKTVIGGKSTLI